MLNEHRTRALRRPADLSLNAVLYIATLALVMVWAPSSAVALTLGLVLSLVVGSPWSHGKQVSGGLLKLGVVGLGFGMSWQEVLQVGRDGLWMAAVTIGVTLAGGVWLARRLQVQRRLAALISVGTAICGGSAIAAMAGVLVAMEAEIAVALGTVFVLNAAALYLFPWLGQQLGMDSTEFGTWAGVAIHDMSSVVGAGAAFGDDALQVATAVKLSRTLWIVPVALAASYGLRHWTPSPGVDAKQDEGTLSRPALPWFIVGFLLASLSRDMVPGLVELTPWLTAGARRMLLGALFLIGAGLSLEQLRAVGWRPLALGGALWVMISGLSLGWILFGAG